MQKYDDPVEVRRGPVGMGTRVLDGPELFLWRGQLWKVCDVIAQWAEGANGEGGAQAVGGRQVWRVEAGRGALDAGIFDLARSAADGRWLLVGGDAR